MAEGEEAPKVAVAAVADASKAAAAFQTLVGADDTAGNSAKVKFMSRAERAAKSAEGGEFAERATGTEGWEYGELVRL